MPFDIIYRKGLEKAAAMAKSEFISVYKEFYKGAKQNRGILSEGSRYREFLRMTGLPNIPKEVDKMATTPQLQAYEPKLLRVEFEAWRGGFFYLDRDLSDDQLGFYREMASTLGTSMAYTLELQGHYTFNQATNASILGGWDRLSLQNSAHKLLNGQTYSNVISAGGPTEATLQAILDYFDRVPNDNGRPMKVNNITLYVHTKKYRAWRQLVGSNVAFLHPASGSADNSNSGIQSKFMDDQITVVGTPYFENETLVVAVANGHELVWIDREKPKQRIIERDDPQGYLHTIEYRGTSTWVDARHVAVVTPS